MSPTPETIPIVDAMAIASQHFASGRLGETTDICRAILATAVTYAPALHLLGLVAARQNDLAQAATLVRRAVEADPAAPVYASNLCELLRRAGDLDAAAAAGEGAVAVHPDHAAARNNLGIVRFDQGAFDRAAELYREAIALTEDYVEAHSNLGNALRALGRLDDALVAYRRALEIQPDHADGLNNLATALRDLGRPAAAEAAYRRALTIGGPNAQYLTNLALALVDLDRGDEASAALVAALEIEPFNPPTLAHLARLRLSQNRVDEARAACDQALALNPRDPGALNVFGLICAEQGALDGAADGFRRAIAIDPTMADAHNNLGNTLCALGALDQGRAAHERAVALQPRETAYLFNLVDGRTFVAGDDPLLLKMEALADQDLAPLAACRLGFALAKAYGDLGSPERAMPHLLKANRLERARITYDEPAALSAFDRIRDVFSKAFIDAGVRGAETSDAPVFIVGMPRSGTSLIEQILASHPDTHGAGEIDHLNQLVRAAGRESPGGRGFPDFIPALGDGALSRIGSRYVERLREAAPTARRIVDKMPANFFLVGLIAMILPNARVIHVRRHPADTCLSCFSKLFAAEQPYAYDLAELGRYYRSYDALMAYWRGVLAPGRMLEITYEAVVADLESAARRLIEHCGLDWNERCLNFHQTARPVRTASLHQVRRPLYTGAVGRWRAYESQLGPLLAELGERRA